MSGNTKVGQHSIRVLLFLETIREENSTQTFVSHWQIPINISTDRNKVTDVLRHCEWHVLRCRSTVTSARRLRHPRTDTLCTITSVALSCSCYKNNYFLSVIVVYNIFCVSFQPSMSCDLLNPKLLLFFSIYSFLD